MTEQTASRRRPRFFVDPRFLIGLLLVAASVGGVLTIVSTADSTIRVYTARDAIAPGDRIDSADLIEVSVRLDAADLYLLPGDIPDDGLVVVKAVAEGELVPSSAVGLAAGLRLASIVVTVAGQLPASVGPGSTLDLWASSQQESSSFGPPSVIVSGATVVRQLESDGLVTSGDVSALELLVPRSKIARVLEAIANEDALSVIPSSIPAKG